MRFLAKLIALALLVAAVIAGTVDAVQSVAASRAVLTPLGQAWFDLSPATLGLAQAAIQRYLHPYLWDPVMQWVLIQPSFAVLAALSLAFYLLGKLRRRPKRFRVG